MLIDNVDYLTNISVRGNLFKNKIICVTITFVFLLLKPSPYKTKNENEGVFKSLLMFVIFLVKNPFKITADERLSLNLKKNSLGKWAILFTSLFIISISKVTNAFQINLFKQIFKRYHLIVSSFFKITYLEAVKSLRLK
jgi:hypothetical protein